MRRRRITGSGLNAHLDEGALALQQLRTVRRCQRTVGQKMDELNEVAKTLATIMLRFTPGSRESLELRESVIALDTIMIDGDKVAGWLDDWILARQAKEQAHDHVE